MDRTWLLWLQKNKGTANEIFNQKCSSSVQKFNDLRCSTSFAGMAERSLRLADVRCLTTASPSQWSCYTLKTEGLLMFSTKHRCREWNYWWIYWWRWQVQSNSYNVSGCLMLLIRSVVYEKETATDVPDKTYLMKHANQNHCVCMTQTKRPKHLPC